MLRVPIPLDGFSVSGGNPTWLENKEIWYLPQRKGAQHIQHFSSHMLRICPLLSLDILGTARILRLVLLTLKTN